MKKEFLHFFLFALIVVLLAPYSFADNNDISRISVDSDGGQGNRASSVPALSSDGRYVAFQSDATDLIEDDNNGKSDIFLHDRVSAATSRISLDSTGSDPNNHSRNPSLSSDGQIVVFESEASDLVSGDDGIYSDIYMRNIGSSTNTRISLDTSDGNPDDDCLNPSMNSTGTLVVFESEASDLVAGDTNGYKDIFLRNLSVSPNTTTRLSFDTSAGDADDNSSNAMISAGGGFVVFQSDATDLVSSDDNGRSDIFIYSVSGGTLSLISMDTTNTAANGNSAKPAISSDGRYVVFQSDASDLVEDDENSHTDIFLRDRTGGTTTLISKDSDAGPTNGNSIAPFISADGNFIIYLSDATDIVTDDNNNTRGDGSYDVFVYNRGTGITERKSLSVLGNDQEGSSADVTSDSDGTVYAFTSTTSDFIQGDTNNFSDVYVVDESCPTDSDSDSTVNCSDDCPYDSDKISEGICGCGVADTDTDADGTQDCNDECASDADKIEQGDCGCGVSDSDTDGNGIADCRDPTSSTTPQIALINGNTGGKATIIITPQFVGVRYKITIKQGNTVISRFTTRKRKTTVALKAGTYIVRYKIIFGDTITKSSPKKTFKVL